MHSMHANELFGRDLCNPSYDSGIKFYRQGSPAPHTMAPHVKSKRRTLRHKYKVEKKVREHHRKVRRANKSKVAGPTPKNKRKDPGIPNLWPYKTELLQEIERRRQEAKEARAAARAAGKDDMAAMAADAERRAGAHDRAEERKAVDGAVGNYKDAKETKAAPEAEAEGSRKAFMKEFRRVVDSSDVILEVLDARDPIGCRCFDAERAVVAASGGTKRIVLVLNKVDLVPREVVEKWLAYLRNEFPTVAFRAGIQSGKAGNVGQAHVTPLAAADVGTADCLGAGTLMSLLKNYTRSRNIKTAITVGVIGFPNVGKSAVINSLKRCRAVSSGSMPGVTRSAQEVKLDKNIRLIDCPGIVFSDQQADALVLRNCISPTDLADPISPVEIVLKRIGPEPLMAAYTLPAFDDIVEFLALIAKMRGKMRHGGALDIAAAAVIVLQDWNAGKIPFYTLPPKGPRRAHLSAAVVQNWGSDFDVNDLVKREENADLDALARETAGQKKSSFAAAQAVEHDEMEELGDEEASEVDEDDDCMEEEDAEFAEESDQEGDDDDDGDDDGNEVTFHVAPRRNPRRTKQQHISG